MDRFAVIYVDQCYDSIEDVTCLGTYATEELASKFITDKNEEYRKSFADKILYIEKFIDENIEFPYVNTYQDWLDFLKPFPMFSGHVTRDNFKAGLKRCLLENHPIKSDLYKKYNPPEVLQSGQGMWVVEIK